MKRAVGVGVPLMLILAVSAYLILTASKKDPLSEPGHRVIKRSLPLHSELEDALKAAAAEDAPAYVKDKRFLPAIANLAGNLLSSGGSFDAGKLTDTIKQLGGMENMGPDIMAQSVQQEAEVTAEVEKEVAEDTVDKIFGKAELEKKEDDGAGDDDDGGGGQEHEIKAEVDFVAQKGMVEDDMFAPPGMQMKIDVEEDPRTDSEPDESSQPKAFSYPMGMGPALMNGCFGTGYKKGDPCWNKKAFSPVCENMMEGCAYIGVGFDGRGDYSSTSRRKTVVQRNCKNKGSYRNEDVPDTMNVHGIFDTDVGSYVFESRQAAVESAYGKESSSQKQSFMSLIQCDVIRYEIFLDEITPDTLSLPFLRDFLALPKNFIEGKAKLQRFIIRYGTHFIKSAKFGGSFRLFKTQEASKSESMEDFSIQAQASYNSLFFNAGGHFGMGMSSGSSQSSKTSNTHVTVEGGDQEVASIVADFYSTGFKDTFVEWLKSIPAYPKPIEMFMGTMSELLDMNYKLLFPFDISDAADGCFSEKYCDFTSVDKFQEGLDKKRLALERAIVMYMEEGPVPTTDFRLTGGKPGCTTEDLGVKGGSSGTTYPKWIELINGDTYKIIFDIPENINYEITKNTEAFLVYARGKWNCHTAGSPMHMYNSRNNGGSGDTNNKKVLGNLPRNYANLDVARAEDDQFWLGMKKTAGVWRDGRGTALGSFTSWASGEPNNRYNCAHIVFGDKEGERRDKCLFEKERETKRDRRRDEKRQRKRERSGQISWVNVALLKPAHQSSGEAPASRAVDGDTNSDFGGNSCTHSRAENSPTWYVDLGETSKVTSVVIYNRDDCCGDRLNPFNIHIGDFRTVTDNPKCGGDQRIDLSKPSISVSCPGMRGRYVGIRLPGANRILALCEVQVFARICPEDNRIVLPSGKTYTVPESSSAYEGAQEECRRQGGIVAIPRDKEEQRNLVFLKNCVSRDDQFWLGMKKTAGVWRDGRGTALGSFTSWASGEPNNRYNCAHIVFGDKEGERRDKWAGATCLLRFRYVCEIQDDLEGPGYTTRPAYGEKRRAYKIAKKGVVGFLLYLHESNKTAREIERLKLEGQRLEANRDVEKQRLNVASKDLEVEKERLALERDQESRQLKMASLDAEVKKEQLSLERDLMNHQLQVVQERLALKREQVQAFEKIATATDTWEKTTEHEQRGWVSTDTNRVQEKHSKPRYSPSEMEGIVRQIYHDQEAQKLAMEQNVDLRIEQKKEKNEL
uniref:MACPF domain-containing protein n=1 Tax=Branchiostoma floridae TaxID=7739 RepID=C3ZXW6_BRAFL|eukprot:XP_002586615.1 hypothetical protein BRAFLDRAFT_106125 [Branchiostoma floridae]